MHKTRDREAQILGMILAEAQATYFEKNYHTTNYGNELEMT